MTLLIAHGTKIYADRKYITSIGTGNMQAAEHAVKLVKTNGACYALCGSAPITSAFERIIKDMFPKDIAALITLDWLLNNIEKATGYPEAEICEHISIHKAHNMVTVMLESIEDYLKMAGQHMLLKTPYSTFVIDDGHVDNMPGNIPYALGSFGVHAQEMLAARAPVKDIYRTSHEYGCMTSKVYDEVDVATPEFMSAQPDVYNIEVYLRLNELLRRTFTSPTTNSGQWSDEEKDVYVLILLNLTRVIVRGGHRSIQKDGSLVNILSTKPKKPLNKFLRKGFSESEKDDQKVSYVLAGRKAALKEAEVKAAQSKQD